VAIKKRLVEKHTDLVICEQKMYFGFLNRFQPAESPWHGSIATTYQRVKEISPHRLRKLREMKTKHLVKVSLDKWETIPDSGWHFSNIGGIERYKTHCDTCDYELPSQKTPQIIKNSIQLYPIVAIDASFPRFIREHKDYLTTIGLIDVQD
jgi:hypothetical protein